VDQAVQIVGLAARFLVASGVPPVAVFGACILLAVLIILAPAAASSIWAVVSKWKTEPGTVADEAGVIEDRGATEGGGPAGGGDAGGMG
jgi:hypothetical protein